MDSDLMTFALMSKPADMLECAAYFEVRGEMEKAVQLYQKGGNIPKALDLCFQAQLFDELHQLTDELGPSNTSPAILKKCIDFFITNGQYEKAVHLCLVGERISEALDVCLAHNVKVTEEMAERMTPPKDDKDSQDKLAQKRRTDLLLKLAKCCKQQGSYHLATKKYTQAGNKLKAMKCLLKSGDTEKVIFFANVSRNNEIYILAANYLQNLDWRNDGEVLKHIVAFYTKARAVEQLATFYSSCAQYEIEEFRDYEKAIGALQEAIKVISKSRLEHKEKLLKMYEQRVLLIDQFVAARQMMQSNSGEMVQVIRKLLEEDGVAEAIRVGDAYAMLVEAYNGEGDYDKCAEVLNEMKQRGLVVKNYLDPSLWQELSQRLGLGLGSGADEKGRRGSSFTSRSEDKSAPSEAKEDAKAAHRSRTPSPGPGASSRSPRDVGSGDEEEMEENIEEEVED